MDTGVKAGIIKCATDEPGVTQDVERILQAAARAHRATGVPISTHTHPASEVGLKQQDVFESEGVDLSRVVIGHSGDSEDIAYLRKLCDRGSYIGMDRFGVDVYLPTPNRVATIAKMCELGYAEKMVLSHDASCYFGWVDPPLREKVVPNWHFNHIPDDVIPALMRGRRQRGADPDDDRRQPAPHLRAPGRLLKWRRARREFGDLGERLAVQHLLAKGYRIRERNFRVRQGEIDIIAEQGDLLAFVEVRCRQGDAMGTAVESLTPAKQQTPSGSRRCLRPGARWASGAAADRRYRGRLRSRRKAGVAPARRGSGRGGLRLVVAKGGLGADTARWRAAPAAVAQGAFDEALDDRLHELRPIVVDERASEGTADRAAFFASLFRLRVLSEISARVVENWLCRAGRAVRRRAERRRARRRTGSGRRRGISSPDARLGGASCRTRSPGR